MTDIESPGHIGFTLLLGTGDHWTFPKETADWEAGTGKPQCLLERSGSDNKVPWVRCAEGSPGNSGFRSLYIDTEAGR